MLKRRVPTIVAVLLVLALTLVFAVTASAAPDGSRRRTTTLTGAVEVPGPGDPDGGGSAIIKVNLNRHMICYKLFVTNIDPATAAHIHVGAVGVAGPVVVGLGAPASGQSRGCIHDLDPVLLQAILRQPENYYVNVHNVAFPSGAVRGQLKHPGPG